MIVKKITANLFDVFSSDDSGWNEWSRIRLDHRKRMAFIISGNNMPDTALQNVVNTQILPLLEAEQEYDNLMLRIRTETRKRIRERISYPHKTHYVTNKDE